MNRLLLLITLLTTVWLAVFHTSLSAQGFARKYPGAGGLSGGQLKALPDGYALNLNSYAFGGSQFRLLKTDAQGYLTADNFVNFADTSFAIRHAWLESGHFLEVRDTAQRDSLQVSWLTPNGTILWSRRFDVPKFYLANYSVVAESVEGNIYLAGKLLQAPLPTDQLQMFIIKISPFGDLLWTRTWQALFGQTYFDEDVWQATADDGIMLMAHRATPPPDWAIKLMRFGGDGALLWETKVGNLPSFSTGNLATNAAGQIGVVKHNGSADPTGHFISLDANGDTLVNQLLTDYFAAPTISVNPRRVFAYPDSAGWLLAGLVNFADHPYPDQFFLMRLNNTGALQWTRTLNPFGQDFPFVADAIMLDQGSCVLGGVLYDYRVGFQNTWLPFLMKVDSLGRVFAHSVEGWVRLDQNLDCEATTDELPFPNAVVQLAPSTAELPIYLTTDTSGYYYFTDVDTGHYEVRAFPPNGYWEPCDSIVSLFLSDSSTQTAQVNLPMQALTECPFLTVNLSTIFLRPCLPSRYTVQYCNYGSTNADSAYIQIVLDPVLTFDTASIAYTQNGDTLYFALGTVAPFECGNFFINVTVACDSITLGQVACVQAAIFPDSLCDWSGAIIQASGYCDGDSVRFQLRNIGSAPNSNGLNFIIADDHVIMLSQPLPILPPNGELPVTVPADGSTWRIIADQEPNNPGYEIPSVAVEGCGMDNNGEISHGFFLQFPNTDGNPFTAESCQEILLSWDPNDKSVVPQGFGLQHFIEQNTPLDYQIRFQNTGTDTAFTVVVKDTLSAWLDPATVRPGAASHPYTWTLSGAGILTFIFDHILLPDSNVNEAASHGFIQFSIDQRKDVAFGTVLENRAGIYFDFNAPVMTNTVFHTIGHDFLLPTKPEPLAALPLLQAWPNPANQSTSIWAEKPFEPGQRLVLRNALGHVVREMAVQGQNMEIQRAGLPAGLYFVELRNKNRIVAVGKVVWK